MIEKLLESKVGGDCNNFRKLKIKELVYLLIYKKL
jgi:hypothetical protein